MIATVSRFGNSFPRRSASDSSALWPKAERVYKFILTPRASLHDNPPSLISVLKISVLKQQVLSAIYATY